MLCDFHVLRGSPVDILFFPRSYRLFKLARNEGDALINWQTGESAVLPPGRLGQLIAADAGDNSESNSQPWGDTTSLCLYVAHDCNLQCTYCYNNRGHAANPGMMMAPEIAEAAFRRFFTVPGRTYAVSMYGGEPLMNYRGIKAMVEVGSRLEAERGIHITYSVTTNGVLLNRERIRFLGNRFSSISVSVDGPKSVHDRYRIAPKGSAYDLVLKHLPGLLDYCGDKVSLVGTLTGTAAYRYTELLDYLRSLGTTRVSLAPVDTAADNQATMDVAEFEAYSRQHEALCVAAIEGGMEEHAPQLAINVVTNMLTRRKLRRICNAGCDPAITADGSIYACHSLVGIPEFAMGNVADLDRTAYTQVCAAFAKLDVDGIDKCSSCWVRYFCGGQCYVQAYFHCGSIAAPDERYCDHVKRCVTASIKSFITTVEKPTTRERLYANARKIVGAMAGNSYG